MCSRRPPARFLENQATGLSARGYVEALKPRGAAFMPRGAAFKPRGAAFNPRGAALAPLAVATELRALVRLEPAGFLGVSFLAIGDTS